MKTIQQLKTKAVIVLLLILDLAVCGRIFAQDKAVDININTKHEPAAWYSAWWVWVVGLAVFVIIIVAIISAGKKK